MTYKDWHGAYKQMPEMNAESPNNRLPQWTTWLFGAILVWAGIVALCVTVLFVLFVVACLSTDQAAYRQQFTDECHARGWHVAYQSDGRMLCQEPGVMGGISR